MVDGYDVQDFSRYMCSTMCAWMQTICIYVCIDNVYMYVCKCVYIYIHIHNIHIYIYIHRYTYMIIYEYAHSCIDNIHMQPQEVKECPELGLCISFCV